MRVFSFKSFKKHFILKYLSMENQSRHYTTALVE